MRWSEAKGKADGLEQGFENGKMLLSTPLVKVVWDSSANMWLCRTFYQLKNSTSICIELFPM
jgi:hypothetical protein